MELFDLHCDTPYALYQRGAALSSNDGHISLDRAAAFESYAQVMAIWTEHALDDEAAFAQFLRIREDFLSKIPPSRAALCTDADATNAVLAAGKSPLILMVEGARLLAGDIGRLETLYALGVRVLTLVWRDADCIGGAFNTEEPLTAFGRRVVAACFDRGILVDLSHACGETADETLAMAEACGIPVLATHSNSFSVCPHRRNLTDERAKRIGALGGLIGISMAPQHLEISREADIGSVCRHIAHYLSLGLEDSLAFGCDFDGIDSTPRGISNLSDMPRVSEALSDAGVSAAVIHKICFGNAARFFETHLR